MVFGEEEWREREEVVDVMVGRGGVGKCESV